MNKRMKLSMSSKKVLAGILAAAMMLSQSSMTALADEVNAVSENEIVAAETEAVELTETVTALDGEEDTTKTVSDDVIEDEEGAKIQSDEPDYGDIEDMKQDSKFFKAKISNGTTVTLTVGKTVKEAKYFKFWRVMANGAIEPVLEDSEATTKKTEVKDKNYNADASGIYIMTTYNKNGNELPAGTFVTIPSIKILSAGLKVIGDEPVVQIAFDKVTGTSDYPVRYDVKAATQSPWKESKRIEDLQRTGTDTIDPTDVANYPEENFTGRRAVVFNAEADKLSFDRKFANEKDGKCYLFITPFLDRNGNGLMESAKDVKISTATVNAKVRFPGVDILYVGGHGEEDHDICRTDASVYVEDISIDYKESTPTDKFKVFLKGYAPKKRFIEITKIDQADGSASKAGYAKVTDCKKVTLVTALDGTKKEQPYAEGDESKSDREVAIKVPLKNTEPDKTYTYRARFVIEEKEYVGAYGDDYDATGHFVTPEGVTSRILSESKIELKWLAEKCAKNYTVIRTKDKFETVEEALNFVQQYQDNDYTIKKLTAKKKGDDVVPGETNPLFAKAGGIENGKLNGEELTLKVSVPSDTKYYGYLLIPVSAKDGMEESVALGLHGWIPAPSKVNVKSQLSGITLSWKTVSKATSYNIYMTTSSLDGEPIFGDTPDLTVNKGDKAFKKPKIVFDKSELDPHETYYFGVTAVAGTDESEEKPWGMGKIQTTPVTSLTVNPYCKNKAWQNIATFTFRAQKDFADVDKYAVEVYEEGKSTPIFSDELDGDTYTDSKGRTKNVKSGSTFSVKVDELERSKVYTFKVTTITADGIEGVTQEKTFAMPGEITILTMGEKAIGAYDSNFINKDTGNLYRNCNMENDGSTKDKALRLSASAGTKLLVVTDTQCEGDYLRLSFDGTESKASVSSGTKTIKRSNGKYYHYITVTPKLESTCLVKVRLMNTEDIASSKKFGVYNPKKTVGSKIRKTDEFFYVYGN